MMITNFPPLKKMNKLFLAAIFLSLFVTPAKAIYIPSGSLFMSGGGERFVVVPTPGAPGPVGILGAVAAFGYSRKLRNRIGATKND